MSGLEILMICGSVRVGSVNEATLRTAMALVPDGVSAALYDGMGALPHFNPDHDQDPLPPAVADLRTRIEAADALLFCTPEYAGDLPGGVQEPAGLDGRRDRDLRQPGRVDQRLDGADRGVAHS